jgi:hypothetical protein
MTGRWFAAVSVASTLLWSGVSFAADLATPDEARALFDRAIAALKADETAALKAFNDDKDKQFRDRDLYVFCFSLPDGNFTAYLSPVLLGSDVRDLKLPKDPVGQRAYDVVAKAPEGEVVTIDFEFPKPGTKQPVPKQSIEERVGNQACGVSFYK